MSLISQRWQHKLIGISQHNFICLRHIEIDVYGEGMLNGNVQRMDERKRWSLECWMCGQRTAKKQVQHMPVESHRAREAHVHGMRQAKRETQPKAHKLLIDIFYLFLVGRFFPSVFHGQTSAVNACAQCMLGWSMNELFYTWRSALSFQSHSQVDDHQYSSYYIEHENHLFVRWDTLIVHTAV